jgi:uncharacterized membrane-anchored protein YitT (DUF2179 family)
MIVLNSIFTDIIPARIITEDTLLISIFGGIINGLAISICLNSGATSGGTDFISIFLSERRGIDSFNIILGFNAVIICISVGIRLSIQLFFSMPQRPFFTFSIKNISRVHYSS